MSGLSAAIDITALPRALGPRCGLNLRHVFGHLVVNGMTELQIAGDIHRTIEADQSTRILNGVRLLGRALRGFASVGHRCKQPTVAGRLGVHASRLLFEVNETHVRNDTNGKWELFMAAGPNATTHPPVDVGSALRRASEAMLRQSPPRYKQAGLTLALALVYAAGGDNDGGDEPLGARDVWGGFATIDPNGRIRGPDELEEHFGRLRRARLNMLVGEERRLQAAPVPALPVPALDNETCCCCWALPTDAQEQQTNTAHLY